MFGVVKSVVRARSDVVDAQVDAKTPVPSVEGGGRSALDLDFQEAGVPSDDEPGALHFPRCILPIMIRQNEIISLSRTPC